MGGRPDREGPLRIRVRGRVQGVCFRDWTIETARALGLAGWVRNRTDGSVEIMASGPAEALEAFVEQCRCGPPAARVDSVEREAAPVLKHAGFTRRPTE